MCARVLKFCPLVTTAVTTPLPKRNGLENNATLMQERKGCYLQVRICILGTAQGILEQPENKDSTNMKNEKTKCEVLQARRKKGLQTDVGVR
jgi:hypothetical protein